MSKQTFTNVAIGKTATEAFNKVVKEAQYEYGHGGYSGTIAEKSGFVMIAVPAGVAPRKYANDLINDDDPRISDKWGPAGCIDLGNGKFFFFGWASS